MRGSFPVIMTVKGPWYYVDCIYKNILILSGSVIFYRMIFHKFRFQEKTGKDYFCMFFEFLL